MAGRRKKKEAVLEAERIKSSEPDDLTADILREFSQSFRFGGRRLSDDQAEDMFLHQRDRAMWRATRRLDAGELDESVLMAQKVVKEIQGNLAVHADMVQRRAGGDPDSRYDLTFTEAYEAPACDDSLRECSSCGVQYRPQTDHLGFKGTQQIPYFCAKCVRDTLRSEAARAAKRRKAQSGEADK